MLASNDHGESARKPSTSPKKRRARYWRRLARLGSRLVAQAGAVPMPSRVADFSPAQVGVLAVVLMLLVTIPVWTHPLPPLSDYVNHLARMHVIANDGVAGRAATYYTIEWQILPNLMMDLIVPTLGRWMGVYAAGQVFTVAMLAVMMSGVLALNRALLGRWSVWPLIAMPLLYNHIFLVGVMNYLFGIGLAMWALAAWIVLRERAAVVRLGVATLFCAALFFCHLFAVGLYGMGLLAYEGWRLAMPTATSWRARLIEFVTSGLPALIVLPLLLASPTMKLAGENYWEPRGKIDGLMYVIQVYSDIAALAMAAIVLVAMGWAARHRLMRFHPVGSALLGIGTVVYLAMPRTLFASYLADQRLPIAIAFMLIATADLRMPHRLVRRGFIAVLLTLVAIRVIEVDASWSQLSAVTKDFRHSVRRITTGSKVLVAYADHTTGDDVNDLGLVHAACIAIIERNALVTTAFTVPGKQILRTRPEFRSLVDSEDGTPPSISELLVEANHPAENESEYWRGWNKKFDYVYVLFTSDDSSNPDPKRLALIHEGERFHLYRIIKQ